VVRRYVEINRFFSYVATLHYPRASVNNFGARSITKLNTTINSRLDFASKNYVKIYTTSMGHR
jgi:hypothetical protein